MLSDLLYTVRSLVRARWFALTVIGTLAIGIGSAAAIFSVADWMLFRTHLFPEDVYRIANRSRTTEFMPIQTVARLQAAESAGVLSEVAATTYETGNVVLKDQPIVTALRGVTANFFPLLQIKPAQGRGFEASDAIEGAPLVAVISHPFWRQQLGGRPDVLGYEFIVDQRLCRVVGVLGEDQVVPPMLYGEVFIPRTMRADPMHPWLPNLFLIGKLRPGIPVEAATEALDKAPLNLPPEVARFLADFHVRLLRLSEIRDMFRPEMYATLLGAVGFVYAIACLNAANLMLIRILGRRRDLCIRLAIGGGRWSVFRLFVLETGILSLLAIGAGVLVARWLFPIMMRMSQGSGGMDWQLSSRALVVLCGLGLLCGASILAVPLVRVFRMDIQSGLRDGGAALGESRRLRRLRSVLVGGQAAFAVVLLAGAALMMRTMQNLNNVDLGFTRARHAQMQLAIPSNDRPEREARLQLLKQIQETLRRVPGVEDVGYGTPILLTGYDFPNDTFRVPGGGEAKASLQYLSPNFTAASGMRLTRGRWLDPHDKGSEILVNESFVRRYLPQGEDPLGQVILAGNATPTKEWPGWRIVGVLADTRQSPRLAPGVHLYGPEHWYPEGMNTLTLRLSREADPALDLAVRRALYALDPVIVATPLTSFDQQRRQLVWFEHFALSVLRVLAALALVLATVGIFTVLSYSADQRMTEFGVRLAFGATPQIIAQLVATRGLLIVGLGVAAGVGASLALTRFLTGLLYGISPYSPWVFAAAAAGLLGAAALAAYWPARRAARAQPSRLLRAE